MKVTSQRILEIAGIPTTKENLKKLNEALGPEESPDSVKSEIKHYEKLLTDIKSEVATLMSTKPRGDRLRNLDTIDDEVRYYLAQMRDQFAAGLPLSSILKSVKNGYDIVMVFYNRLTPTPPPARRPQRADSVMVKIKAGELDYDQVMDSPTTPEERAAAKILKVKFAEFLSDREDLQRDGGDEPDDDEDSAERARENAYFDLEEWIQDNYS